MKFFLMRSNWRIWNMVEEQRKILINGPYKLHSSRSNFTELQWWIRKNDTFDYYLAVFEPYRGKGYAKEMILMVLRFFFLEFAYPKVNTTVYSFNNPSMRLHEKLGFMQEGQLRNILFTKGAYYDGICYGMTRQEFELNHAEYYF